MLQIFFLSLAVVLECVHGQLVETAISESCSNLTVTAVYQGLGNISAVEWYYSRRISTNLLILATDCTVFGSIDSGFPPSSRMMFLCPSTHPLPPNTYKLVILDVTETEMNSTWGAAFRISGTGPTSVVTEKPTSCSILIIVFDAHFWRRLCIAGVVLSPIGLASLIILIISIFYGQKGKKVVGKCTIWDIVVAPVVIVVLLYSLIVGAIAVSKLEECRKCTKCDKDDCDNIKVLASVCIAIASIDLLVLIVFIFIRQGWCGERLTCLNTVLPVCKDTEARGPPDGKSDNTAAKEKHREVKLLTHKEQTQQHHRETVVNKGKPSGEKHEELSKGQPRPLPVPTGNNRDDTGSAGAVSRQDVVLDRRPMPDIPSDRHKRGLSANYSDDRDKPLDDNILHTLPVVNKPKTALDPLNAEDQSKNADDQPKKKKKKKKDRDTSRSEEMEDGY